MRDLEPNVDARFSQLYERHYWAVLRYALRRVNDEGTARDVAAEAFAVAWRRWGDVPQGDALPWLYAVTRRVVANELRRQDRANALTERLGGQLWLDEASPWRGRLEDTLTALRGLSSVDQEVLRLHAWEGLAGRDLATALNCSVTAAAVRLHRARRRLRQAVASARATDRADEDALPAPAAGPMPVQRRPVQRREGNHV